MKHKYESEQQLCADFTTHCLSLGMTVYAETGEFDMLVVYPDGRQLGVEAKLRLNEKVLSQILPEPWQLSERGPTHRAVLVPVASSWTPYIELLAFAGVEVITAAARDRFDPVNRTYRAVSEFYVPEIMHDWNPVKLCKLPDYVPDVIGGASGPVKLTEWKIKALRVMAELEIDGSVTRQTFKRHGLDYRRWSAADGWLRSAGAGKWVAGTAAFHLQHPTIYARILEEIKTERAKNAA